MRQSFIQFISAVLLLSLMALPSRAQYLFKDVPDATSNGLASYTQNFDALAGTKNVFTSNTTLLGVYAKYVLDSAPTYELESSYHGPGTPAKLGPDDGTEGPMNSSIDTDGTPHGASWYHFGAASGATATDRALGGIASTTVSAGKGYVGIRLKNSSTKEIKNLEISYAMEQWYNSSNAQAANVTVDYQKSTTDINSLIAGTWTNIAPLGVAAPSTSTVIAPRNGNSATNRRVLQTTVAVDLAVGEEVMIRFGYVFNSSTNGNGLSVDDIVITPETNVFYSLPTGTLTQLATWGTNLDGTGTPPANFTDANQLFYVQSPKNPDGSAILTFTERIGNGGVWTVSGTNSKIVVGSTASPAVLRVSSNSNIRGSIDVGPGSYLYHNRPSAPGFTLGTLASTSTVEFNSGGVPFTIPANQYGNLKATGGTASDLTSCRKELGGSIVVTGNIGLGNFSKLVLGDYDLTLLSGGAVTTYSTDAYVVTNSTGCLRAQVPRGTNATTPGAKTTFPVGSSLSSYTPVTLRQTSTASDDVFEVRVMDGVATTYNASTYAPGTTPVTNEVVKKTWLISKEVPVNPATVNMTLQWNATDATANFVSARAHINHYTGAAWDNYKTEMGTTGSGPFVATRIGLNSFSPFSVSSRTDGALPVELLRFTAQRIGTGVACAWATASEKSSRDFTVERSADGQEFSPLGKVAAAGTSTSIRDYAFTDKQPLRGLAYYRLRQTDLDGTEAFSPVVAVSGTAPAETLAVVPNPGTSLFTILAADGQAVAGPGVVFNALGAVVLRLPEASAETTEAISFDLSSQPAGLYLVQLQTPAGPRVLRIIKK